VVRDLDLVVQETAEARPDVIGEDVAAAVPRRAQKIRDARERTRRGRGPRDVVALNAPLGAGRPADAHRGAARATSAEGDDAGRGNRATAPAVGAHEARAVHAARLDGRRAVARALETYREGEPHVWVRPLKRDAGADGAGGRAELTYQGPAGIVPGGAGAAKSRVHVEVDALDRAGHPVLHRTGRGAGIVPGEANLIPRAAPAARSARPNGRNGADPTGRADLMGDAAVRRLRTRERCRIGVGRVGRGEAVLRDGPGTAGGACVTGVVR